MKYDFKKYMFLYTIGSLLGYFIETLFCFLKYHHYIIKKGMIIGVFKPLYGIGLLIIYLFFKTLKNKSKPLIFIYGIIIGTIYEYCASLFETYILHTNTWDYSQFNLNFHGRIYLPYSLLWGIIVVLSVCYLLPLLLNIYEKLNSIVITRICLYILTIFMLFNLILTTCVFFRYGLRHNHIKPLTFIGEVIDYKYHDEYIHKNFPRLKPVINK